MKKILSLITVFAMLSVFTGCNKADVPDMSTETTTTATTETTLIETVATEETLWSHSSWY